MCKGAVGEWLPPPGEEPAVVLRLVADQELGDSMSSELDDAHHSLTSSGRSEIVPAWTAVLRIAMPEGVSLHRAVLDQVEKGMGRTTLVETKPDRLGLIFGSTSETLDLARADVAGIREDLLSFLGLPRAAVVTETVEPFRTAAEQRAELELRRREAREADVPLSPVVELRPTPLR